MQRRDSLQRREFIGSCSGALIGPALGPAFLAAVSPGALAAAGAKPIQHARARLVDERGAPLAARRVPLRRNLVFSYPYVGTPAFLLNLPRAIAAAPLADQNGQSYRAPAGVGPDQSIVAFAAICTHQLAYPAREISFISFREKAGGANRLADVIHCCAEHSQYDPAAGAKVVAGPAPQPLMAILLEHDAADDSLTAVGTIGGDLYEAFFQKYAFKLALEHGGRHQEPVAGQTVVRPIEQVCQQQVRC